MIASVLNPYNYFFNLHSIPFFASGILIIAESIFVFLQNRKSSMNRSFALATLAAGVWLTGLGMMYCSLYEPVADIWSRYYAWLGIIFITPGVYLFSIAWEGSKKVKFISHPIITGLIFYCLSIFTRYFIKGVWHYSWGFYPRGSMLEILFLVWFAGLMILSFRNFIKSYQKEKIEVRKKQTRLIIAAFTFGFIGSWDFLANFGVPMYAFGGPFAMMFSTVMAYAIVNYRAMEIETVIHKTIAWFFTSAALVAPLAALFYFTRHWYTQLSPVAMWSYFGIVFLGFMFFVTKCQPNIDSFFQKGRVYIDDVLNKFTDELVHLKSLDQVTKKIIDTISQVLHVNNVRVALDINRKDSFLNWLAKNDHILSRRFIEIDPRYENIRSQAEEYFKKSGAVICIPMILNENIIGIINIGEKAGLAPFSGLDYLFLNRIKSHSTIAVSNSLVYDKVEEMVRIKTEELMQAQKQLVQAEKLATVGTLAGGVAHEINNPLAAILTNAQMMLSTVENKDDKESLEMIEEAAKRCRSIVQKLMVYSRKPMAGREVLKLDLKKALDSVNAFLGYQLSQENIKVNVSFQGSGPFLVDGSQNEIEQVITNLFLNSKDAIKKVAKAGEINVSVSKGPGSVIIKVSDTGCGISKEYVSKIFDPFFTTKDVGKGTGLGLSICQSIIEEHKGTITVESGNKQRATFIITLPAIKSA